jgi:hypothetical protein
MKRIEYFNNVLNSSLQMNGKSNISSQVDYLLKSLFSALEGSDKALIIGAGNCSDFSLGTFTEHFEKVYVTDVDKSSVKQQMDKANIPNKQYYKMQYEQVEYTGYEEIQFFTNFKQWLGSVKETSSIDRYIGKVMDETKDYQFLETESNQFDFIYVSPIYTQLIFQQYTNNLTSLKAHGVPEHILKYAEDVMLSNMTTIIDRFNDNIRRLIKPDGYVFVLSDILELQVGSMYYQRIKNAIGSKEVIDSIYQDYFNEYGYGFGDYGLYNLDQKMTPIRERWMLWEFSHTKHFLIKLKIYHSKKEEK